MPVIRTLRDRLVCWRLRPALQAYLDGEVDDDLEERLAVHVRACRRCAGDAAAFGMVKRSLAERRREPDPEAARRLQRFIDGLSDQRE